MAPSTLATAGFDAAALEMLPGAHQVDLRERQRTVILAYSRRSLLRCDAGRLMLDAVSLIGETLQVTMRGIAELTERAKEGAVLRLSLSGVPGTPNGVLERDFSGNGEGLLEAALREGRPVLTADLAADTRFRDPLLKQLGVVSALVVPLRCEGQQFGAVSVYSPEAGRFSVDDCEFAETIGHLLTSTMARVETSQSIELQRRALATLLQASESIVVLTDVEGHVQRMNYAGERVSGYAAGELESRQVWSTLALPEEIAFAHATFRQCVSQAAAVSYENTLLTKQGQRRRIRWSLAPMLDEFGAVQSVVLTGIDITEQRRLEAELQKFRATKDRLSGTTSEPSAVNPGDSRSDDKALDSPTPMPFAAVNQPGFAQLRSSPRRAYPYRQMMAPMWGAELPRLSDFREVQFRDISAGGVSFLVQDRPNFDRTVLALGCPPNFHYMSGQVVNVVEEAGEQGPQYLVGCRFLDRVHPREG